MESEDRPIGTFPWWLWMLLSTCFLGFHGFFAYASYRANASIPVMLLFSLFCFLGLQNLVAGITRRHKFPLRGWEFIKTSGHVFTYSSHLFLWWGLRENFFGVIHLFHREVGCDDA